MTIHNGGDELRGNALAKTGTIVPVRGDVDTG